MKTLIGFIAGIMVGIVLTSVMYLFTPVIRTEQWKANGELTAELMCYKQEADVWHGLYQKTRDELFKYQMKEEQGVGESRK